MRNRVKRRLRDIMRRQLTGSSLQYDFIIVARTAIVDAAFSDLYSTMQKFLTGLGHEETVNRDNKII